MATGGAAPWPRPGQRSFAELAPRSNRIATRLRVGGFGVPGAIAIVVALIVAILAARL